MPYVLIPPRVRPISLPIIPTSTQPDSLPTHTTDSQNLTVRSTHITPYQSHPAVLSIPSKFNENAGSSTLWTVKYRPRTGFEVLGNEDTIVKLRKWLSTFELRRPRLAQHRADPSGNWSSEQSDEILHSTRPGRIALLKGPPGVGKTVSVYALADELGWEVFEWYPGRAIRGTNTIRTIMKGIGANQSLTSNARASGPRGSLILFDEVDILFTGEGLFWASIKKWIEECKRPVIMTCNGNCDYGCMSRHNS